MILVDTCVWSLAYRRKTSRLSSMESAALAHLKNCIEEDVPVIIPGIVYQELLSGLRETRQRDELTVSLSGFPIALASRKEHSEAAVISDKCRKAGMTASTIDCLIASQCIGRKAQLLTLDRNFELIVACAGLRLVRVDSRPERR